MGKWLDKFKGVGNTVDKHAQDAYNKRQNNPKINHNKFQQNNDRITPDVDKMPEDDIVDEKFDDYGLGYGGYDEVGIQQAQKPESFHHFILENQYKDLEMDIRGYKDVYDKDERKWRTVRKKSHCFTDEEAEEILRTAQSHLSTDVKLGHIKKEVFGLYMDAIFKQLEFLFESIAENEYGRYGGYDEQYRMKRQNLKIFLDLWTRIQMNYSRAIEGRENVSTHGSVKGQESLQNVDGDLGRRNRGYM